jgi:hypothetical protein
MGEGEPGVDPSSLKDNPMAIEREVLWPPFFYKDAKRLALCA